MNKQELIIELNKKFKNARESVAKSYDKGQTLMYEGRMAKSEKIQTVKMLAGASIIGLSRLKEIQMLMRVKHALVKSGLYKEEEIALDINEFLEKKGHAKVMLDSIDYRANINKGYLRNLELVWGNACFLALDTPESIKNLKYVVGDVQLRELTGPVGLEMTCGKTYIESLDSLEYIPSDYEAIGGVVTRVSEIEGTKIEIPNAGIKSYRKAKRR